MDIVLTTAAGEIWIDVGVVNHLAQSYVGSRSGGPIRNTGTAQGAEMEAACR